MDGRVNQGKQVIILLTMFFAVLLTGRVYAAEKTAELGTESGAESDEKKGYAVFREADDRDSGFKDTVAEIKMVLINKKNSASERSMKISVLEGPKESADMSLIVFQSPKDQKGTALLTHQKIDRDDDQWLYLPALKRVKKISSSKKSGPFVGSEFSFEDVGGQIVEDYTYKFLRQESCEGKTCFVVESYPKDKHSGYTRIVNWIDTQHYRTLKSDFYDRKNSHLKTLKAKGYQLYKDTFWRADELHMDNHQTGRKTILKQVSISFDNGMSKADFNKNSLKRAK